MVTPVPPPPILLALGGIGVLVSPEPEAEPVEIAGINRGPVRGLPFDVMLVGKDAQLDGDVVLAQGRECLEREQPFLVGQLEEDRRAQPMGCLGQGYRRPECGIVGGDLGKAHRTHLVGKDSAPVDEVASQVAAAGAERRGAERHAGDQGIARRGRSVAQPGDAHPVAVDVAARGKLRQSRFERRMGAAPLVPVAQDRGDGFGAREVGLGLHDKRWALKAQHRDPIRGQRQDRIFVARAAAQEAAAGILDDDQRPALGRWSSCRQDKIAPGGKTRRVRPVQALDMGLGSRRELWVWIEDGSCGTAGKVDPDDAARHQRCFAQAQQLPGRHGAADEGVLGGQEATDRSLAGRPAKERRTLVVRALIAEEEKAAAIGAPPHPADRAMAFGGDTGQPAAVPVGPDPAAGKGGGTVHLGARLPPVRCHGIQRRGLAQYRFATQADDVLAACKRSGSAIAGYRPNHSLEIARQLRRKAVGRDDAMVEQEPGAALGAYRVGEGRSLGPRRKDEPRSVLAPPDGLDIDRRVGDSHGGAVVDRDAPGLRPAADTLEIGQVASVGRPCRDDGRRKAAAGPRPAHDIFRAYRLATFIDDSWLSPRFQAEHDQGLADAIGHGVGARDDERDPATIGRDGERARSTDRGVGLADVPQGQEIVERDRSSRCGGRSECRHDAGAWRGRGIDTGESEASGQQHNAHHDLVAEIARTRPKGE